MDKIFFDLWMAGFSFAELSLTYDSYDEDEVRLKVGRGLKAHYLQKRKDEEEKEWFKKYISNDYQLDLELTNFKRMFLRNND